MQHLLLLITTMSACVASAMHIEKRDIDNPLVCRTAEKCVSSYDTGSVQCRTGYTRTTKEVPGYPLGSYCEKPCDESERSRCTALQCTFYETQCTAITAGTGTICGDALNWCGRPIRTTKSNCVQLRMNQPVKYNDATGFCAADPDAPKDDHELFFFIQNTGVDPRQNLRCVPVTSAGAESVIAEMEKVASFCAPDPLPKANGYQIRYHCEDKEGKFDSLTQVFKDACAVAAHPGDAAPTSEAYRS